MLDKIRNKIALSLLNRKSISLTDPQLADIFRGVYSLTFTPGQPVYTEITTSKAIREGYKMAMPVYRAIRAIVQAGSGIPWIVLDKNGEEIPEHDFTLHWNNPNPEFSGQDNMEYVIAHLILGGNAYLRPIYYQRQPVEYWIEMPDLIQPIPSSNREKWIEGYQYTMPSGEKVNLKKETFLHFKQLDPGSLYLGMGAIQSAGRVIDTYNEALDTQKVSMQNRGMPSGHLFPEEPMTPEQFDEFKRKFKEQYLDKASRREPWLYPRKMQWIEASQTAVEMDFTNSQAQLIRQIAAAIGIDPWWLGDKSASTYNNVIEARKALYEDVTLPILDDVRATLNLRIAPLYDGDIYITYDTSNIPALRQDFGQKIEQAKSLWAMGIPFEQINQKLELGFEEFPGWERGYLPFSVAPVGESGEIEQSATPEVEIPEGGEKSLNPDSEEYKVQEWKRVDTRRRAWERVLAKKFEPLYKQMGVACANAAKGDIEKNVKGAIDKQSDKWLKTLSAIYFTVIEDFGNQIAERLKVQYMGIEHKASQDIVEKKFDPFATYVRTWVTQQTGKSIVSILGTQKDSMIDLIKKGIAENQSNYQIAKSIRSFYTERANFMAMRVARTEAGAAASFGQKSAAKEAGMNKKGWLSSRDDRVRDSHVAMDGEIVGIDEVFSNGCSEPGIGSDPAETINCRCTMSFSR